MRRALARMADRAAVRAPSSPNEQTGSGAQSTRAVRRGAALALLLILATGAIVSMAGVLGHALRDAGSPRPSVVSSPRTLSVPAPERATPGTGLVSSLARVLGHGRGSVVLTARPVGASGPAVAPVAGVVGGPGLPLLPRPVLAPSGPTPTGSVQRPSHAFRLPQTSPPGPIGRTPAAQQQSPLTSEQGSGHHGLPQQPGGGVSDFQGQGGGGQGSAGAGSGPGGPGPSGSPGSGSAGAAGGYGSGSGSVPSSSGGGEVGTPRGGGDGQGHPSSGGGGNDQGHPSSGGGGDGQGHPSSGGGGDGQGHQSSGGGGGQDHPSSGGRNDGSHSDAGGPGLTSGPPTEPGPNDGPPASHGHGTGSGHGSSGSDHGSSGSGHGSSGSGSGHRSERSSGSHGGGSGLGASHGGGSGASDHGTTRAHDPRGEGQPGKQASGDRSSGSSGTPDSSPPQGESHPRGDSREGGAHPSGDVQRLTHDGNASRGNDVPRGGGSPSSRSDVTGSASGGQTEQSVPEGSSPTDHNQTPRSSVRGNRLAASASGESLGHNDPGISGQGDGSRPNRGAGPGSPDPLSPVPNKGSDRSLPPAPSQGGGGQTGSDAPDHPKHVQPRDLPAGDKRSPAAQDGQGEVQQGAGGGGDQ